MKDYRTVEALLNSLNLTREEFEFHKELIEECLENERKITEYSTATKKNMEKIATVLTGIYDNMITMENSLENLAKDAEELYLKMVPSDEFYRE
jgi:hypothetical protein